MDELKYKMSADHGRKVLNPFAVKKPKKRSIVERELETNLTAHVTSPVSADGVSMSRYGRARRMKAGQDNDRKITIDIIKSPQSENTPVKIPISKPSVNSPFKVEVPKKALETSTDNIDNINQASLSPFHNKSVTTSAKKPKVYIRTDLTQNREDDDDIILIKDLFSSPKSVTKPIRSKIQSTEKYLQNGHIDNTSVVKTLDFDGNKHKKGRKQVSELFNTESQCHYQVGDLVWARMGTFPFWPCIVTRDPANEMFVRKKLFGRVQHDILHVTFFADNGRHNWVVDNMLRKYNGLAEFVSAREKFTAEDKKKDPRLYAAFFISEKKQSLWNNSVEEAEMIQREPKRIRIDIFNDLLHNVRASKRQLKSGKITRTDSDVSLSESLYDSLFSEDDNDDAKSSKSRSKNPKIDVSDVVTACLDNMAAKTGNSKIQRQSHMDRWLQKAKSKTPEKVKTPVVPKIEVVTPNTTKIITPKVEKNTPCEKSSNRNKRKQTSTKPVTKVYSLRRSYVPQISENNESENELKIQNEFGCKVNQDVSVAMDVTNEIVDSNDCDVIMSHEEPVIIDLIDEDIKSHDDSIAGSNKLIEKSTDTIVNSIDDLFDENEKAQKIQCNEESNCKKVQENLKKEIDSKRVIEESVELKEILFDSRGENIQHVKIPQSTKNFCNVVDAITEKNNDQSLQILNTSNDSIATFGERIADTFSGNDQQKTTVRGKDLYNCNRLEDQGVRSIRSMKKQEEMDLDECTSVVKGDEKSISITMALKDQISEDNSETKQLYEIKCKIPSTTAMNENQETCVSLGTTDTELSKVQTILDTDKETQISELYTDEKKKSLNLMESVQNVSPLKGDAMVLIPDISDDDSNLDSDYNARSTDIHDHNSNLNNISNLKSKNGVDNVTEKDNSGKKTSIKNNKSNAINRINESLTDSDITTIDECDTLEVSGGSESILDVVEDLHNILNDKPKAETKSLNKIAEKVECFNNKLPESSSLKSKPAFEEVPSELIAENLASDNKNTYFREVTVNKPPDLRSDSLAVKAELLLGIESSDEDDSDDEPSPEFEPLGDEITEDFRQHLKCIESNVTDKNDDAQLVKVCDEIVLIEESNKLKSWISPVKYNVTKLRNAIIKEDNEASRIKIESENIKHTDDLNKPKSNKGPTLSTINKNKNNIDLTIELKSTASKDKNKPDKLEHINLTKQIKEEKINLELRKSNEIFVANNIFGSLKSPPVKKCLSLNKNKPKTSNTIDKINKRYKTVKQNEDIIKREPKILPLVNGEINIPEIKKHGYYNESNDTPDLKDDDFDIDDASLNSEDSEVSLPNSKFITTEEDGPRRSLRSRPDKKEGLENPEFLTYYELNVDNLMDEYPELSEENLLLYCYQTFLYKENLKSDTKQTEEVHQIVKGLKQETPSRKKTKKIQPQPKNTLENIFREKYENAKKIDFDLENLEGNSDCAEDVKPKREVCSVSPVDSGIGRDSEEISGCKRKTNSKSPLQPTDVTEEIKTEFSNDAALLETTAFSPKTPKRVRNKTISPKNIQKHDRTNPVVLISPMKMDRDVDMESASSDSDLPLRQLRSKVVYENKVNDLKKEIAEQVVKEEVETASVTSDNEPLFRAKKANKTLNTNDDPEFIKYLELKMDAVVDENPELSYDEVKDYLRKVYDYENSSKTDTQKNEEIESSNLVKGLNQEVQPPKKPRRKLKTEKTEADEVIAKDKPKRKTVQHYFNEAYLSDIEDEDVFEIFKTKKTPIAVVSKTESSPKKEIKIEDGGDSDESTEEISTQDEVELYFKQLTSPKPNVFKGLAREKVCEICEDVSNLLKCKGCNGTFHYECVITAAKETETPVNAKGRKKKKPGRKRKSQEHESDERHDISEEIIPNEELENFTFDAANLEEHLEAKMKEILEKNNDVNYDSYSSDDGIDWSDTVAGKCEIVDVKLKLRAPSIDYANFKCNNCRKYSTPVCFVCKSAVSKTNVKIRQKCNVAHCHCYYHIECLDHWPQTQFNAGEITKSKKNERFEALTCPRHVCHTCVSDDPRGCKTRFCGDKLARCVRCPATYHSFNKCLPAGTQILTASYIICPRHYEHRPGKVPCHVNTGWCFICALGGSLICCEYCPTSFHPDCLNIKPPEGNYMCEDCETGRLPLYGEMVWVKLGHYRWWPGVVLHPSEIPDNIMAVKHGLGEFVVRFFGQYDHYWVNRGRVFPYQEGDSGRISSQKSKIDADFTTAMEHAQRAFEILKNASPDEEEESDIAASLLPPHYIKLKSNKPIGSLLGRKIEDPSLSLTQCECDPNEIEPCGPNTQCLNRMLLTECGPTCRAGDKCNNRAFEKRLYPKLTPYKATHRGWGLKTLENIKAGQFVIEYVGELLDEEEFQKRMRRKHEIRDENFYFLTLDKERMIDAGPKGNSARFMNHCCEPNCETQKWTVLGDIRVGLFAINDIPANSEVTFNYNLECTGIEKKRCLCGAQRCSGYIGAKPKQDESVRKKNGLQKRVYKKRKNIDDSPSTSKIKVKKPVGRPPKPKELTEIEKDLLIIKNATTTSSGESSRRQSVDDKTKPKIDSKTTEQGLILNEMGASKNELKTNSNVTSESTISNIIDESHIPRPLKIKIKLGNSPEQNTSEVVSNNGSKNKVAKMKIDFNAIRHGSVPNGIEPSELSRYQKLKRRIDSTENGSISLEPSAKKQKCDQSVEVIEVKL